MALVRQYIKAAQLARLKTDAAKSPVPEAFEELAKGLMHLVKMGKVDIVCNFAKNVKQGPMVQIFEELLEYATTVPCTSRNVHYCDLIRAVLTACPDAALTGPERAPLRNVVRCGGKPCQAAAVLETSDNTMTNYRDADGFTLLMTACEADDEALVQVLLRYGADFGLFNTGNPAGYYFPQDSDGCRRVLVAHRTRLDAQLKALVARELASQYEVVRAASTLRCLTPERCRHMGVGWAITARHKDGVTRVLVMTELRRPIPDDDAQLFLPESTAQITNLTINDVTQSVLFKSLPLVVFSCDSALRPVNEITFDVTGPSTIILARFYFLRKLPLADS